jgi:hypothetical protein
LYEYGNNIGGIYIAEGALNFFNVEHKMLLSPPPLLFDLFYGTFHTSAFAYSYKLQPTSCNVSSIYLFSDHDKNWKHVQGEEWVLWIVIGS